MPPYWPLLLLLIGPAWAEQRSGAPSDAGGRLDVQVLAGFVTGQDIRVLLVEAPWTINRFLSAAPAYASIQSPSTSAHQLRGSITAQVPLGRFVLDDRNLLVGSFSADGGATLYRNRLRLTYPFRLRGKHAAVFMADERFYDLRSGGWTRHWISAGASHDLTRGLAAQVYFLRQSRVGNAGANTVVCALVLRLRGLLSTKG